MTELPPIIERLDALYEDHNAWADFMDAMEDDYPKLRAELLRLQEERDRAVSERDANTGPSEEEFEELEARNHALLEALKEARDKVRRSSITSNPSDGFQLRREALDIMNEASRERGGNR